MSMELINVMLLRVKGVVCKIAIITNEIKRTEKVGKKLILKYSNDSEALPTHLSLNEWKFNLAQRHPFEARQSSTLEMEK